MKMNERDNSFDDRVAKYLEKIDGDKGREKSLNELADKFVKGPTKATRKKIKRAIAEVFAEVHRSDAIFARHKKMFGHPQATKSLNKLYKMTIKLADYLDGQSVDKSITRVLDPYAAVLMWRQGFDAEAEAQNLYNLAIAVTDAKKAKKKEKGAEGGGPRDREMLLAARASVRLLERLSDWYGKEVSEKTILDLLPSMYFLDTGKELPDKHGKQSAQIAFNWYQKRAKTGTVKTATRGPARASKAVTTRAKERAAH